MAQVRGRLVVAQAGEVFLERLAGGCLERLQADRAIRHLVVLDFDGAAEFERHLQIRRRLWKRAGNCDLQVRVFGGRFRGVSGFRSLYQRVGGGAAGKRTFRKRLISVDIDPKRSSAVPSPVSKPTAPM